MGDADPDWMSSDDTKRYLGVAQRTLYRLVDQEELPAYRLGRVIRFRRHEVDAWIQAQRIVPGDLRHLYPATDDPASMSQRPGKIGDGSGGHHG